MTNFRVTRGWVRRLGLAAVAAGTVLTGSLATSASAQTTGTTTSAVERPAFSSFIEIVNDHAGACVDVVGASTAIGALIQEFHCTGGTNQQWSPVDLGNGFFELQSRNSGLCMNVQGDVDIEGARIDQQRCSAPTVGQWWRLEAADGFGDLWLNSGFTEQCLALDPNTSADHTHIVIGNCSTSSAKLWHFATP